MAKHIQNTSAAPQITHGCPTQRQIIADEITRAQRPDDGPRRPHAEWTRELVGKVEHSLGRKTFEDLPPPQQAGILCNDPRFQQFAAIRTGAPQPHMNNTAAAEYLRQCCGIRSRRELSSNPTACRRFAALKTEFDAWLGRIPPQR